MSERYYKILHINLARGWRGGEEQTWRLMQVLHSIGHHQAVCAHPHAPFGKKAAARGFEVVSPCAALLRPHLGKKWDVVHAHDGRGVYVAAWLGAWAKRPYVITRRDPRRPKSRPLTIKAYCRAGALVGISSSVCEVLSSFTQSKHVYLNHDAHFDEKVNPAKAQGYRHQWLGDNEFLVGHAGALVDRNKGQSDLIKAIKRLNAAGWRLKLVLMGEGPDRAVLEEHIDNDPNIQLVGQVTPVRHALAALDLFVFPSHYEALGSVLIEAMRSQVPVIAANTGGIPDIVKPEITGMLFEPGNISELVNVMEHVLSHPSQRRMLADNGYAHATALSPTAMAKKYLAIYQTVLANAGELA